MAVALSLTLQWRPELQVSNGLVANLQYYYDAQVCQVVLLLIVVISLSMKLTLAV